MSYSLLPLCYKFLIKGNNSSDLKSLIAALEEILLVYDGIWGMEIQCPSYKHSLTGSKGSNYLWKHPFYRIK